MPTGEDRFGDQSISKRLFLFPDSRLAASVSAEKSNGRILPDTASRQKLPIACVAVRIDNARGEKINFPEGVQIPSGDPYI